MAAFRDVARNMTQDWVLAHIPKGPANRTVLGTTDGWAIWGGTKAKNEAWELVKFITTPEYYTRQATVDLLIPPRKSVFDAWMNAAREVSPGAQKVNLNVVRDALITMGYPKPEEIFLCQFEAGPIVQRANEQIFRDGTASPRIYRDLKPQIDQAAGGCGVRFK
jgi:ABC-type glycerol-3-phosphate transport system substrate-binding protein